MRPKSGNSAACSVITIKRGVLSAILGLMCFVAHPALGTLILYEGFDYPNGNGTQLQYLSGGSGWVGGWGPSGNTSLTLQKQDWYGLPSYAPEGGTSPRIGGVANKAANGSTGGERLAGDLSSYFTPESSIWFSYLVTVRGDFNGRFNMGFAAGSAQGSGIGISIENEALYARINSTLSSNSVSAPLSEGGFNSAGTNRSFFIVGRFDKGTGPSTDVLQVWVNQGTNLLVETALTVSELSLNATPDRFSFNSRPSTSSGVDNTAIWLDEVKMGTTADSIGISVIPEPGTLALLGISFIALMANRRFRGQ